VPEITVESWLLWVVELDGRLVFVDSYPSWAEADRRAHSLARRPSILKAIVLRGAVVEGPR
jgi:hypothetical protein